LDAVTALPEHERKELAAVTGKYVFRANEYYLGLIDWSDPQDPIRRIIIPQLNELTDYGELDASNEERNYAAPGCQHKYPHTALLICTEVCGGYCRFCFRKRLFMDDNEEAVVDVSPGIEYIRRHPRISNVLLTGGDPLFLSTRRLEDILARLREIDHVRIIRIGSKMPAFNPYRIIDDPTLLEVLARYSLADRRIYVMTHFNSPRELTPAAREGLVLLQKAGVILANQTPVLRGINDRPADLAELMNELSFAGVTPYYFFQCRPTIGNYPFGLTLTEAYESLAEAKARVSGLAKRARLVMSHESGKIEIVGLTDQHIYMRYHRARARSDESQFMIYHRDDEARWLDELTPAEQAYLPDGTYDGSDLGD